MVGWLLVTLVTPWWFISPRTTPWIGQPPGPRSAPHLLPLEFLRLAAPPVSRRERVQGHAFHLAMAQWQAVHGKQSKTRGIFEDE